MLALSTKQSIVMLYIFFKLEVLAELIYLFRWVHLVCALYTPGVAFGDVDKLSPVTLFEMPYSRWGLRVSESH